MVLQNRTPLPMAWRLSGLENLGEDFSMSQDEGIVGPHTEFGVHLYFKATKALTIKKMIRLEVRGTVRSQAEGSALCFLGVET